MEERFAFLLQFGPLSKLGRRFLFFSKKIPKKYVTLFAGLTITGASFFSKINKIQ